MDLLNIEATKYTPEVIYNPANNSLSIKGKSYPENTFEFYAPILDWIKNYFNNVDKSLKIDFEVIYYNSSSSKMLYDMFDLLTEAISNGNEIVVNWYYHEDNEAAEEAGEDFKEDFESININLLMI